MTANEPRFIPSAKAIDMGEIRVVPIGETEEQTISCGIVLQFDDAEMLRSAIKEGLVSFSL